ncbi:hypothetical protein ACSCBZ_39425 [Streptomyces niveiscabiei]|uniref:hypothetical protein n=1 Tax=Streptomyces niveiscabiei TaxID=164115 RepID=UPI0006EB5603|nr:hypothetical protein [Streptomyces niveiscabiei]
MDKPIETPFGPMDAVANWLRANGIDPCDVPIHGPITIDQGRIRYAAHLRNEAGRKYVDETTGDVAQEERTAPLKVEPPANVQVTGSD